MSEVLTVWSEMVKDEKNSALTRRENFHVADFPTVSQVFDADFVLNTLNYAFNIVAEE